MDDQMDRELIEIRAEHGDSDQPWKETELQILAALRYFGRQIIARGEKCPCCGAPTLKPPPPSH